MTAAIIAAGVILAWLGLLAAMSGRRDVEKPKPKQVTVTLTVDADVMYAALSQAGVSYQAFADALQKVNQAMAKALPSVREMARHLEELEEPPA